MLKKSNKKIIKYIVVYIFFVFGLPIIFTPKKVYNENTVNEKIEENIVQEIMYDYKEFSKIKLLKKDSNEIEELYLDEYLKGVIASEMPASYEIEALKAQAVVARTYTIYKIKNNGDLAEHNGANICNDNSHCQAWISKEDRFSKWQEGTNKEELWSKICFAVESTKGEIITYDGLPINAFFHANSGGITESSSEVWGGDLPYLEAVVTARRR